MKIVCIGLSITSSWGNGHATTYRALLKEMAKLGHEILFLEKDAPYYASNCDMPNPDFCKVVLYKTYAELVELHFEDVRDADFVMVGSYVQQGVDVGHWVCSTAKGIKAFYDIDTPVTLAKLRKGDYEYISPDLISKYDMYLSFSGGAILEFIQDYFKSPAAFALYCSVDTDLYYPENLPKKWDLGYLGTYSIDRQPAVTELLCEPAALLKGCDFVVAGPQYPSEIQWPQNVQRIEHLPPAEHRMFYNSQRFTLNVTRADMIAAGYSPSVRLFEAGACGVPIISDYWDGITSIFENKIEILIPRNANDVADFLTDVNEEQRIEIGMNARAKILKSHTAKARAKELEQYIQTVMQSA